MLNIAMLLQDAPNKEAIQHAAMAMLAIFPLMILIMMIIIILPFWFICKKAGFSPWMALLNIIPFGGLVLIYMLAFAEWKVVPAQQPTWQPPMAPPPLPPQV